MLEGECCLTISDKIHQMTDNVEMNLEMSQMSENMETGTNREKVRSKTFTITVKCSNAKFSIVK